MNNEIGKSNNVRNVHTVTFDSSELQILFFILTTDKYFSSRNQNKLTNHYWLQNEQLSSTT